MNRLLYWLLLLATAAVAIALGVMNPHAVTLHYPGGSIHWPLSLMLALAFAAGLMVAGLFSAGQWLLWRWRERRLKKRLARCESDQVRLRQQLVEQREQLIIRSNINQPVKRHE